MDDIDIYLRSALKKDAKLRKFIEGTLKNGPASDSDDENSKDSLSCMPPTSSDPTATDYRLSSVERAPVEMNQSPSCDPCDTSSFEVSLTEDDLPDLTLHFAEPNDFEKNCVSAHVKRLRREIQDSAKRKAKRHEQPKQRQFTGKPIDADNSNRRAMKPKPRRRQKLFSFEDKSNDA